MKLLVFTVRDSVTEAYMSPFFGRSKGEAIRSFSDAVNAEDHQFSKHADDYTLFQIGEWDDQTGMLVPMTPVSLGVALEYRRDGGPVPQRRGPQLELEDAIREANRG